MAQHVDDTYRGVVTTESSQAVRALVRAVSAAQVELLRHGDAMTAPLGQSSARWRVLLNVHAGAGTAADIARTTGYSRQGVQRLVDVLVADGSLVAEPDPGDARRQHLSLTRAGCATLGQLEEHFDTWADRLLLEIGGEQAHTLTAHLAHLAHAAAAERARIEAEMPGRHGAGH